MKDALVSITNQSFTEEKPLVSISIVSPSGAPLLKVSMSYEEFGKCLMGITHCEAKIERKGE